ncbi:peptidoglycan-binding protein [Streptomyces sp. NPDC029216]|uniref:peptidoglycan-binding protein n=1 Tax=Streptomyces sp. NPDC029216 TaxID=3154701 RepID=UPI0033F386EB
MHITKRTVTWSAAAAAAAVLATMGVGGLVTPAEAAAPSTYAVKGLDTSHYSHNDGANTGGGKAIDWPQVVRSGQKFAFLKATEGNDWTDRWFARDMAGAARAGILRAPYHFYGRTPGASQAEHFVRTVRAAGYSGRSSGELPPAIDLETRGGKCPANLSTKEVKAFLSAVERELHVKPIVYTSASFVKDCLHGDASALASRLLWQPRYGSGSREPVPIPGAGTWTIWQYSETGHVSGVPHDGDVNVFHGTEAHLRALAAPGGSGSPGTPAPTERSWPLLREGSQGTNVHTLQLLLAAAGAKVTVDGSYGPATTSAVKAFQHKHHLKADGITGPDTWSRLATSQRPGDGGSAVRAVQEQLNAAGAKVTVDGSYGPATTSAVKAFQHKHHLKADGITGPDTWAWLLSTRQG